MLKQVKLDTVAAGCWRNVIMEIKVFECARKREYGRVKKTEKKKEKHIFQLCLALRGDVIRVKKTRQELQPGKEELTDLWSDFTSR